MAAFELSKLLGATPNLANLLNTDFLELLPLEPEEVELAYVDTKDPEILRDFLNVRREVYAGRDVTAKSLSDDEGWNYGNDTHIIAVLHKNKCVGGTVLIINHSNGADELFPMEKNGFRLKEQFPELDLQHKAHAVFKSIFTLPEFTTWTTLSNIFRTVNNVLLTYNVKYIFATAHPASARRIKLTLDKMDIGMRMQICKDVTLPYEERWNGVARQLMFGDLHPLYEKKYDFDSLPFAKELLNIEK